MTQEELDVLVELHRKWLNNEQDGKKLVLSHVSLRYVNLCITNLHCAVLHNVDLRGASLCGSNLTNADLHGTDLHKANLHRADLGYADLSHTDLRYTDMSNASLRDAILDDTNLHFANLHRADLRGAKLDNAHFDFSNLLDVELDDPERYRLGVILEKPMTAWKKCRDDKIVKLRIPRGSIVFCVNGKKYRSNKAKVISVNGSDKETAASQFNENFVYTPGKTLEIKDFDLKYNVGCATGIHFFKTRKEAEEY